MPRKSTPSFVVTRRIYVNQHQAAFLDRKMDICNKIYNTAVKHYREIIDKLKKDSRFKTALDLYRQEGKADENAQSSDISKLMSEFKLNEYDIHAYMGYQKAHAFGNSIGINIVQKQGSSLYGAIKKAVFGNSVLHFRKRGQTNSFEDKKATTGIIYHRETDTFTLNKQSFRLKPVRSTDHYLIEAMQHKVKYCRIKRECHKNRYHYFLQIVMEGHAPEKIELGKGNCGVDEGVSTIAYYNGKQAQFKVLADGVEKYEKAIERASRKYERRMKAANPDNYNADGTPKKGRKTWKRTKGMQTALMELKNAHRLKSEHIKQSHGRLTNMIVSQSSIIIKEPMDFRALAKRSKSETQLSDKKTTVIQNGKVKTIQKFKRKKRFGKSILRRAPGLFDKKLCDKMRRYGGTVIEVNSHNYKASQYNHETQTAIKPDLSCRVKQIGDNLVQRDLYSCYLLYNMKDIDTINFDACKNEFEAFLKLQSLVIEEIKTIGDKTKNFGLKQFVA